MKNKEELKQYLLKNYVDEDGNLDLTGLDFSDFEGNVRISHMTVKKNLIQNSQIVFGTLDQSNQHVQKDMFDSSNIVKGKFLTQTLNFNEKYKQDDYNTYIVKKTKEELENLDKDTKIYCSGCGDVIEGKVYYHNDKAYCSYCDEDFHYIVCKECGQIYEIDFDNEVFHNKKGNEICEECYKRGDCNE